MCFSVYCVCVSALSLGGAIEALATEDPNATQEDEEELQVYEKHNPLLHGSKKLKYGEVPTCFFVIFPSVRSNLMRITKANSAQIMSGFHVAS